MLLLLPNLPAVKKSLLQQAKKSQKSSIRLLASLEGNSQEQRKEKTSFEIREREEWRQRRGREEAPSIQKKRGLQKADETFRRSRRRRKGRVTEEAWKAMAMATTRTPLFDVHCHLQDNRIVDTAPSLIKAATKAGVKWMAVNGTSEADWEKVRQMSEHNSCIIPCFGLHPWWASQRSKDWLSKLRCMLESVPCSTVGEIGLCQSIRGREVEESIQVDVLRQQLELARELERPAAIHCVRAFRSLQGLLEEMGSFPAGIILHSYSGSPEFVKVFAKHGAYFSFSGFNTHVKLQKARRVWQQVPRDRLLLETDCPDALPQVDDPTALFWVPGDPAATAAVPSSNSDCCHEEELHSKSAGNVREGIGKGALNQPANLRAILSHVASLLEVTEEVLADAVFTNASTLFSFPGSKLVD